MKKKILALASMAAMLAFGNEAQAVDNVASSDAKATIASGITCAKDISGLTGGDLAFGIIIPSASAIDVVSINANTGVRSHSTSATMVNSTYGPAAFNVTGAAGASYTITLPTGSTLISNGAQTMEVKNFSAYGNGASGAYIIASNATASFKVGADLHVAVNQATGVYSGPFQVTVAYQ